jgi:hypothetical protein
MAPYKARIYRAVVFDCFFYVLRIRKDLLNSGIGRNLARLNLRIKNNNNRQNYKAYNENILD